VSRLGLSKGIERVVKGRAFLVARCLERDPHLVARYAPYRKRPVFSVTINKIPEAIHKALRDAARRRGMKLETIMFQLVGGTIMHGSVDRTLQRWNAYDSERRLGSADAHSTIERRRAAEDQNETGESLEV